MIYKTAVILLAMNYFINILYVIIISLYSVTLTHIKYHKGMHNILHFTRLTNT